MTPQPSAPEQGVAASPALDEKTGGFKAPAAVAASNAPEGAPAPKAVSQSVAVNPSTGVMQVASKPVEIPQNVKFSDPIKVAEAKKPAGPTNTFRATFIQDRNTDGDTGKFKLDNGQEVNCRIDGVDTPETAKAWANKPGQPFAKEATEKFVSMVQNKEISLTVVQGKQEGKNFGRSVCQIQVEGKDVSKELLSAGLGWLIKTVVVDPARAKELLNAESEAKTAKRAIWSQQEPENPAVYRRNQWRLEQERKRQGLPS